MSGDKLLGGPQCGILLGSTDLLERMRRNPLCRALRVDKLTLAALAATLKLYLQPERARREIPVLRMLTLTAADIERRAAAMRQQCEAAGLGARLEPGYSATGGGAAAAAELPTTLLLVERSGWSAVQLERYLRRTATPPVVVRIVDDRVALDLRTVAAHEEAPLLRSLRDASEE